LATIALDDGVLPEILVELVQQLLHFREAYANAEAFLVVSAHAELFGVMEASNQIGVGVANNAAHIAVIAAVLARTTQQGSRAAETRAER